MRRATLAILALMLLPAVQAAPATLYGHLVDPLLDFPMNTQEPDASFRLDAGGGLATHTFTCLPVPPGFANAQDHHTWYGYSIPSIVDYAALDEGEPRIEPERGIQADVHLDPASPMVLHWYLSEPDGTDMRTDGDPLPTPNVVVQATMRAGDSISVDDHAYNEGPVIASGASVPATLAGQASQGVETDQVDGRTVYHFTVPMDLYSTTIPRASGFNVRIDVFVDNPLCADGQVMPNSVHLHSSPDHRPRLELGVLDPVQVEYVHPQFVGDDLVVHASFLDVWGAYDFQIASSNVTLEGTGLPRTELALLPMPQEAPGTYHGHGPQPVERTWVLNGTPVPPGVYTLRISVTAMNGATATWSGQVELGTPLAMPGPVPGALALGLTGLAVLLRRRALV